ncbi:GAP family protein [Polaribacter dokdonensis]|uniref:Sap, sulfolipid-1-addressing protein n=1 Tax=Polaribacter dokdonensis DSW-5 TaxID=1300348 RepID=A0A0M9CGF3_9FLAO|nr:GAP family protein [Polaribacter dokdonensis]KOY51963.1 hypothetical protein I602_1523 [Polaribacter dokdonensis DSW-5]SED98849.1 Sap, sulfolipid-1-addressing protein [Polaribacter dokdonensis DSW-5]
MDDIAILPLALTVMLGPQILVGMLLITRPDAIKSSLIYISTLLLTLIATTSIYYFLVQSIDFQNFSVGGRPALKYILIALFIFLIIKSFVTRNKITEPPKWMTGLATSSYKKIALIALSLIAFMPTDIVIAFSVGNILNQNSSSLLGAIPFFAAVFFIASVPLLLYFSLGSKASTTLAKVNAWLNTHGYVINIIVLAFFIYLLL